MSVDSGAVVEVLLPLIGLVLGCLPFVLGVTVDSSDVSGID